MLPSKHRRGEDITDHIRTNLAQIENPSDEEDEEEDKEQI